MFMIFTASSRDLRAHLTAVAVACTAALSATTAAAGEYVVTGCHGPATPDAAWATTAGSTTSTCSGDDVLTASVQGGSDPETPTINRARWTFTPPPDTSLIGLDLLSRSTVFEGLPAPDDGTFETFSSDITARWPGGGQSVIASCTGSLGCTGLQQPVTWRTDPPGATTASFGVRCPAAGGVACPTGGSATAEVDVQALHLWDGDVPLVGAPSGPLFAPDGAPAGPRSFSVGGVDRGSGLYDAALEVDGVVQQRWPWDTAGSCVKPFIALVPCSLAGSRTWSYDPTGLGAGRHAARILVADASGGVGASPVMTIVVPPAPQGSTATPPSTGPAASDPPAASTPAVTPAPAPAAAAAPAAAVPVRAASASPSAIAPVLPTGRLALSIDDHHGSAIAPFGHHFVLAGRLLGPTGAPLPNAGLTYRSRTIAQGVTGTWSPTTSLATDAAGRFSVRLPSGPSREVQVSAGPGTSASVRISVRARVTFRAPAAAQRGAAIMFTGTIAGGRHKLVALQARNGKAWQTFATTTTDAGGRFAYRFRFRSPGPRARYALRASAPAEAGFPYNAATSAARRITVR